MEGYQGFVKGKPECVESRNPELEKCVRIFPHKLDGEGHFLALLQKGDVENGRGNAAKSFFRQKRDGLQGEEQKLFDEFAENLNRRFEKDRIQNKNGMLYYMPELLPELRGLRFLRSGLFLGEIKKKRFEPSQSLAMALKSADYSQILNLSCNDERTLRYLKGETLSLTEEEILSLAPNSDKKNGWVLVCVDGYSLGWGKRTGATLKNKYHSGWRLM
jgi:NOL1/NOP2/fmu family ribosome biogenesis protein